MLFHVTHLTRYIYQSPVPYSINEARLTPRTLPTQQVRSSTIGVEPSLGFLRFRKDYFGNDVASFGVFEKHERFAAIAESVVDLRPDLPLPDSGMPWEEVRELIAALSDAACLEASEFIYDSPFVRTSPQLAEYAGKTF